MNPARRFSRAAAIAIAIAAGAGAGPGCDGGPIGTGISGLSSAVAGSVAAVPGAPLGDASSNLAAGPASLPAGSVEVSVEGSGSAPVPVAPDGSFVVAGDFQGRVVLRFDAPDRVLREEVDVPPGALLQLPDVVLAKSGVLLDGRFAVNLLGRVVSADCTAGSIVVEAGRGDARETRTIAIGRDTVVTTAGGAPATCGAIGPGVSVLVDGRLSLDEVAGGIDALGISIGGERAMLDRGTATASFAGTIVAADCNRGLLSVADAASRGWVGLDPSTSIRGEDGRVLDCDAIAIGDGIRGSGTIRLADPAVVTAGTLMVRRREDGPIDVRVGGSVVDVDCDDGTIAIVAHGLRTVLRLGGASTLPAGVECGDVPVGAWLRGQGRIDPSRPDRSIEALGLSLWRSGLDSETAAND